MSQKQNPFSSTAAVCTGSAHQKRPFADIMSRSITNRFLHVESRAADTARVTLPSHATLPFLRRSPDGESKGRNAQTHSHGSSLLRDVLRCHGKSDMRLIGRKEERNWAAGFYDSIFMSVVVGVLDVR